MCAVFLGGCQCGCQHFNGIICYELPLQNRLFASASHPTACSACLCNSSYSLWYKEGDWPRRFDHIFGMFRTKAGKVRRLDVIFATYEERAFCILGSGSPAVPVRPWFATGCSPGELAGCCIYCLCPCGVVSTPSWPINQLVNSKLCWAAQALRLPDVCRDMLQEQYSAFMCSRLVVHCRPGPGCRGPTGLLRAPAHQRRVCPG